MPLIPIEQNIQDHDIGARFVHSETVVASPAGAAETIIAQVAVPGGITIVSGVLVSGWAAYTVGTSGTAVQLRIRRTNVAGTVVANSGALTRAATNLAADDCMGFDALPPDGQLYVLTMQVTAGAAASTVSAVEIIAQAI